MTEKSVKPAAAKRPRTRKPKTSREPNRTEISERAYYLHLEDPGADEVGNWLRAESELAAA